MHDVIVVFNDYNSLATTIMRRQVVVDYTGAIVSTVTPTPDIIIGVTLYTLAFSVVSGKLRLTVNSSIGTASNCTAEVTSRYF